MARPVLFIKFYLSELCFWLTPLYSSFKRQELVDFRKDVLKKIQKPLEIFAGM